MARRNCWEVKNCGRQPGGAKVAQLGVCTAATERRTNGVNNGVNGGRSCWALAGTLCGGVVQGSFASKLKNCQSCEFYNLVRTEEGTALAGATTILAKIH